MRTHRWWSGCGIVIAAVLLVTAALGFFTPVNAQPADPLLDEGVQIMTEKLEIMHLRDIGQLDPDKAQQRLQATKQRWDTLSQKVGQWPQEKQRAFLEQLQKRSAAAKASLDQKWAAEARQLQKEGSGAQPGQKSASTVTPARTDTGGARPVGQSQSGPDVLGMRIGTSPNEMREIVKSRHLVAAGNRDNYLEGKLTLSYFYAGKVSNVPNGEFLSEVRINGMEGSFWMEFSHVPANEEILTLYRDMSFQESKRPTHDALEKALLEKYGAPTKDISKGYYSWAYDKDGTLRKPGTPLGLRSGSNLDVGQCGLPGPGTQNFDHMDSQVGLETYITGCGATYLTVRINFADTYAGPNTLVQGYKTMLIGYDAAARTVKTSKAIADKALAAESGAKIKEAEQQKPNL